MRSHQVGARQVRLALRGLSALVAVLVLAWSSACSARPPAEPAGSIPGVEHGVVTVDGGTIHYARTGSGPPLILLHGWPQTWWSWHKVIPELGQAHTVIALDLPGLGDSSAPAGGYDKASTARRVRQAVQQLGFQQVQILAHDIGGAVAHAYARDYPTEVSRLAVIESPLAGFGLADLNSYTWHILFNATRAPIPEQLIDNDDVPTYLGMFFEGSLPPAERELYYQAYSDPADRTAGYEYYRAFTADAEDNRAHAASKRLPMPVLAVGGQRSLESTIAASFRPVAADVREVVAPDSAHFVPEENPRFLIDCVRLFFGDVPAGAPPARPELAGCTW